MINLNKWILTFLPTFFLTGCWDFERLENQMVISGITIESNNQGYTIAVEYLSPESGSSGGQSGGQKKAKVSKEEISQPSVEIPLHSIQTKIIGNPFYANLKLLMIGSGQAEKGISDIISHFIRDPDMRRSTKVAIAEQPLKFLENKESDTEFLSDNIETSVKLASEAGRTISADIGSVSRDIHEDAVVLIPFIKSGRDKGEVEVDGVVILKDEKWIGQINAKDTTMIAFLKENIKHGSFQKNCPKTDKGSIALDIIKTSPSIDPKIHKKSLKINGTLKVISYLSEYTCNNETVNWTTTLKKLEKDFEENLNKDLNKVIQEAYQNLGVDILNVQEQLKKYDPKEWDNVKDQYDEMLKSADINLKTSINIKLKGSET